MRSVQCMKGTHSLVLHKLVDTARVSPRTIRNMQRLHVVIVHLRATDVNVGLQVSRELLAAAVVDLRVRASAQLASVGEVALPSIRVNKAL